MAENLLFLVAVLGLAKVSDCLPSSIFTHPPYIRIGSLKTSKASFGATQTSFSEAKNIFRQRTACTQAVENADCPFRLPNHCARVSN